MIRRRRAEASGSGKEVSRKEAPEGEAGVTPEEVVAAAVEDPGGGEEVPSSVRKPVEARVGVDLGAARVHKDARARETSAAIGARAFAHGKDIYLGPGEDASDTRLMAHELTHVAQQAGAEETPQGKVEIGAADSPAEAEADQVASEVDSGGGATRLIVDGGELGPGQVRRQEFLETLRAEVTATANAALAPFWSAEDCPYIEQWFARHRDTDAASLDRLVRRYAGIESAGSAAEYLPAIKTRLRAGIENWMAGGDVSGQLDAAGVAPESGGDAGTGQPLDASTASRMEDAMGEELSRVRVHTGPRAASKASREGAAAFTLGDDIYFGEGKYNPGTPEGDALLAHELAHTVQQKSAGRGQPSAGGPSADHEQDADRAAAGVIARLYGRLKGAGAALRDRARPALTTGYSLQRCKDDEEKKKKPKSSSHPVASGGPDQREGTSIPDAATQQEIHSELYPGSTSSSGSPAPWDGAAGQPNHLANRAALKAEMRAAMDAFLAARMPGINATASRRRVPITDLEGAGQAAKADVDAEFGDYASAAALTSSQRSARGSYSISASGPDQNLFDAQDPGDRAAVGMAIDPQDLASWIAETAPDCRDALDDHHLVPTRTSEERDFLRTEIVNPFANANESDLKLFDLHGFAMSDPATGSIVLPTSVAEGLSDTSSGSAPSDAERARRWSAWRTMVHEYLHQLEHPALQDWPGSNRTISEGFCELFTKEILEPLLPSAAGADSGRRTLVEGGDHGAPRKELLGGPYDPGSYAGYLAHAEAIQSHLGGSSVGARNAMRAVFFQGHVELLGYDTSGNPLTKPAGDRDLITVPAGITTFADLAAAVNVSESDLRAANPGVSSPLSGQVHAPGCREHHVVVATDASGGSQAETRRIIALQHGVTEASLDAANPGVDFSSLSGGDVIIIPNH